VRLVAAAATRLRPIGATDLIPADREAWRDLRGSPEQRQAVRTMGRRFRRDPASYLKSLEEFLINQALSPSKTRLVSRICGCVSALEGG
jgi:hypothetical protein